MILKCGSAYPMPVFTASCRKVCNNLPAPLQTGIVWQVVIISSTDHCLSSLAQWFNYDFATLCLEERPILSYPEKIVGLAEVYRLLPERVYKKLEPEQEF